MLDAVPVDGHSFHTAYGLDSTGASLVRPDGYIAWRAATAPDDPAPALTDALAHVAAPRQRE
ncbi:aromatic-ring hydroxylase C-terminal domain-containing protein [Nocardia thraciensis]